MFSSSSFDTSTYVSVSTIKPFHDVFVGNFFAGVRIDLKVFDAVAWVFVDLIEADLFGIGTGRKQRDRTSNKGKAQKAFPVGTRGH
ncbi:MAG TPA: hypothetical protein VNO32_23225 [Candidatus Acidoferrum sp.]|nr:hypothetical protein [Candidatus Acidoferrum sp.]